MNNSLENSEGKSFKSSEEKFFLPGGKVLLPLRIFCSKVWNISSRLWNICFRAWNISFRTWNTKYLPREKLFLPEERKNPP